MDIGIFEFLTIIFGIGTIIGIILALKIKRIDCIYFTSLLQTTAHPSVEILFNGEKISNLFSSKILIFNNGTEHIRDVDIPNNKFPTIKLADNQRILSYRLINSSSKTINSQLVKIDDQKLQFKFDYLNAKDGGLVELLYESENDDQINLAISEMEGNIIGGDTPRLIRYSKGLKTSDLIALIIGGAILILWGIEVVANTLPSIFESLLVIELVGLLVGIGIISFGVYSVVRVTHKYYLQRLPKFVKDDFNLTTKD